MILHIISHATIKEKMEEHSMFKKFVTWFILFGLSFLVSNVFDWTEQGKAFLYIHLGIDVVILLVLALILVIGGIATREAEANGISFVLVLVTAGILAITLFATWGSYKNFWCRFLCLCQIMTFDQCLCPRKKDD